jgi:hypothetical protein
VTSTDNPGPVARRPFTEQGDDGPVSQAGRSPVLDHAQLEVLGSYGTEHAVSAGDVLFAEGDETYDLIVVLEGEVQIVANAGRPEETLIATYGPGGFLGEISLLTGQRAFLAAVARTAAVIKAAEWTGCPGTDGMPRIPPRVGGSVDVPPLWRFRVNVRKANQVNFVASRGSAFELAPRSRPLTLAEQCLDVALGSKASLGIQLGSITDGTAGTSRHAVPTGRTRPERCRD